MNVNQLIIDYVYFCTIRGQVLDFEGFMTVWEAEPEITEEALPLPHFFQEE